MIVDCLGREREPTYTWPDGSYNCPFCCAAAQASGCMNPACFARVDPPFPRDVAEQLLSAREEQLRIDRERETLAAWRASNAAERAAERRAYEADQESEAKRRGACLDCLRHRLRVGGPVRFVKHRKECPRKVRAHAAV